LQEKCIELGVDDQTNVTASEERDNVLKELINHNYNKAEAT
jgi:hypothetical protein